MYDLTTDLVYNLILFMSKIHYHNVSFYKRKYMYKLNIYTKMTSTYSNIKLISDYKQLCICNEGRIKKNGNKSEFKLCFWILLTQ